MLLKVNYSFYILTKGDKMIGINDEIENKLNYIGVGLSELQRLSKILQACIDDEENLNIEDVQAIFKILKSKIETLRKVLIIFKQNFKYKILYLLYFANHRIEISCRCVCALKSS